ncbi:hypothetical protein [Micromonospora andamanensis]|uniref:hypothetical protein n=1 Tax=Micromonospora andamanensis TaxID=1287068 RepID=UPI00194F7084|nr:hypothetical protein [Micromonospora andamanensis]GIJ38294.1 hypothetical protein Vwe01_16190 [Micromonospora andamanensis]
MMERVLAAAPPGHPPDILDALRLLTTHGHHAAAPLLHEVLRDGQLRSRRPALAAMLAAELWDPDSYAAIVEWVMKTGRESGSPLTLRLGLALSVTHAVLTGDLRSAIAATAEEEALADATGGPPVFYHRLHLAAMRGRPREAHQLFASATAAAHQTGQFIANVHWSAAILHNGLAEYPAALTAARQAVAQGGLSMAGFAPPELVEAAIRCDEPDTAAAALESVTARAAAAGTATGLGVAAYARGLATGVEEHYREAVDRLADSPLLAYRARAHLLYGEWLRRQGRRRYSREHLRTAHELLSGAGPPATPATRCRRSAISHTGRTRNWSPTSRPPGQARATYRFRQCA